MHLRRLNQLTPEPVRTGPFTNPGFWSPDSRSFVFSDGTNLKKMRVPDGAPEIVMNDVAALVGGSWSNNGTLLVATTSGLYAVSAAGGVAKRIDAAGPPFESRVSWGFSWPEFLPDSEDFLVLSGSVERGIERSEICLATLRDGRAEDQPVSSEDMPRILITREAVSRSRPPHATPRSVPRRAPASARPARAAR